MNNSNHRVTTNDTSTPPPDPPPPPADDRGPIANDAPKFDFQNVLDNEAAMTAGELAARYQSRAAAYRGMYQEEFRRRQKGDKEIESLRQRLDRAWWGAVFVAIAGLLAVVLAVGVTVWLLPRPPRQGPPPAVAPTSVPLPPQPTRPAHPMMRQGVR